MPFRNSLGPNRGWQGKQVEYITQECVTGFPGGRGGEPLIWAERKGGKGGRGEKAK